MKNVDSDEPRWDWTVVLLVIFVLVLVAVFTFELWAPHFGPHR